MKTALLPIVFLLVSHLVFGQIPSMGGSNLEYAEAIIKSANGGYVVAGMSSSNDGDVSGNHGFEDGWIAKLNNIGEVQWQKSFGGSSIEFFTSVVQTADGGYAMAGIHESHTYEMTGIHGNSDFWVMKVDANGMLQWQKFLGGSAFDRAESIVQTADGGFAVTGYVESTNGQVSGSHGGREMWVVKLSMSGTLEWQKPIGGSADDVGFSIIQTSDTGLVIVGSTSSNDGDLSENYIGGGGWIVKLSIAGVIEWQKTYTRIPFSIVETLGGGYAVTGIINHTVSGNLVQSDYWVAKLNNNGEIEWQKSLGGTSTDDARSIVQTTDGGYLVVGSSYSSDGDVSGNQGMQDYWAVKLSNVGTIEWQKSFGGTNTDNAYSIVQADGGYVILGGSYSNDGDVSGNHGGSDFWVVKFLVRDFKVSPNYPCQDKHVTLTSEGCAGTVKWYAYPEGQTPTLIHTGINYNYLVPNTIPLNTAIFFKAECTTTSGFVISMGDPKFVRVLGASSYNFVSPTDDFTSTPPYPLNVANGITAANKILVTTPPLPSTRVEYRAEKGILLKPGFRADKGTVFTAQIGGCQ
jgi:hypothetical protein